MMKRHSRFIVTIGLLCLFTSTSYASGLKNPKSLNVKDESTSQGDVKSLDFTGTGVTATVSNGVGTITIAGGGTVSNDGVLASNAVVIGKGTSIVSTITADTSTSHALFSTATTPAFRNINSNDVASGVFQVSNGGTNISSGNSGGIPYFNSTSSMASSAALTSNAVVIGGGAGTTPSTITADTSTSHFLGSTGTSPAFRQITSNDVSGTFQPSAGGTGNAAYTKGDILVATAAGTLVKFPVGANGTVLSYDSSTSTGLIAATPPTGSSTNPGGANTNVQFNDSSALGGEVSLSWNKTLNVLGISGDVSQTGYAFVISNDRAKVVGNFSKDGSIYVDSAQVDKKVTIGSIGTATTISLDVAGSFRTAPVTLTDGATITPNAAQSNSFFVQLTGQPRTLAKPTNGVNGQKITIRISQDATGSRKIGFGSNIQFGSDITSFDATTTAGFSDYVGLIFNGVSWDVVATSKGYHG